MKSRPLDPRLSVTSYICLGTEGEGATLIAAHPSGAHCLTCSFYKNIQPKRPVVPARRRTSSKVLPTTMRRGREDGVQAKRLRAQAEKDKQEALKALEAKKRRLAQERAISDEAKKEAKKRLEFERDRATNQYYEVTGGNSDPPASSRPRSKGLPGSVSRESGRASAAAPKSKETPPPEVEEQYPGWDRGDGNVPQDLDERAIPFVRRTEDDEDRGSGGSGGEKSGTRRR